MNMQQNDDNTCIDLVDGINEAQKDNSKRKGNWWSAFAAAVAGYLLGKSAQTKIKIVGEANDIVLLRNALAHSKQLLGSVEDDRLDDVTYMRLKKRADKHVKHFEENTGIEWPI